MNGGEKIGEMTMMQFRVMLMNHNDDRLKATENINAKCKHI